MARAAQPWLQVLSRLGLMTMHYDVAYKSDVGMKRLENQDVAEVYAFHGGLLGVVCDGMGGYSGGEVASRLAADSILHYFRNLPLASLDASVDAPFVCLQEAIQWANQQIWDYAQNHENLSKMGTTCVAVLCMRGLAYVAHVGDSRLYLLRERELMRVTRDHSRVQRLVDEGKIKAEDAENHPGANVISRVLGQYRQVQVECQPAPIALCAGDRLMLCSDGLVRMCDEHAILGYLQEAASPTMICHTLIEAANQAGGKDNTTVQLVACRAEPNQRALWVLCLYFVVILALLGWGRWEAGALSSNGDGQTGQSIPVLRPSTSPPAKRVILAPTMGQGLSAKVGQGLSSPRNAKTPGSPPLRFGRLPPPRRLRKRYRRRHLRRRRRRRRRRRKRRRRRRRHKG